MELSEKQIKRIKKLTKFGEDKDIATIENFIEIDEKIDDVKDYLDNRLGNIQEELKKKLESELVLEIDREELKGEDGYTPVKGVDYFDGKDGKNYILTNIDKKQIAQSITVPVAEKIIEKTEVIKEQPIEIIKEVALKDTGEEVINKINEDETSFIKKEKIEDFDKTEQGILDRAVSIVDNRTSFLINKVSNLSEKVANAGNSEVANSTMSTGIIFGGELSINADPTKIDISAGAGYIVDDTVVPATLQYVEWDAFTAVTLTDLATEDSTDIAINSSSAVVQQRSYTNSELRSVIFLGGVDHTGGTVRNTFSVQVPSFAPATSVRDLARAVGDLNISGNTFGAASTNLTISKTSGQSFSFGRNTVDDKNNPHVISQDAVSPITFNYIFQDGSGGATVSTATSNINPLNYDDGSGTLATVGVNDFAFQNILLFPNSNKVFVQYGTTTYNKLEDAINGLASTTFPTLPGFTSAMRRGVLIVKRGTTNLTTSADARFFAADKFGSIAGSVGTGVAPDLSVYVPYTGATGDVDLGVNEFAVGRTIITPVNAGSAGLVVMNGSANGALDFGANVNGVVRTANIRKLAAIVSPDRANTRSVEWLSFDSVSSVSNVVSIGGRAGGSNYASTTLRLCTQVNNNTTGGIPALTINTAQNVSIGAGDNAGARLHTVSETEQFRSGYDTSNYWNSTTNATGVTTFDGAGSGSKFVFSKNVELTQTTTTETITPDTTITIVVNGTTYKIPALAV